MAFGSAELVLEVVIFSRLIQVVAVLVKKKGFMWIVMDELNISTKCLVGC